LTSFLFDTTKAKLFNYNRNLILFSAKSAGDSMQRITSDIYMIENKLGANVFLLGSKEDYVMIDSGVFKETGEIIKQLENNGFSISGLKTIILTHCHCDHIGGVAELVKYSKAKVAAHSDDAPYILQQEIIHGPYHNMMAFEQKLMKQFNCNVKEIDIELKDGDIIDALDGLRVIHVPGHTPGSIALYQDSQRIMFFGDVIRNKANKGLSIGLPEKFNVDTKQVIADANKLLGFPIEYALFGHGSAIMENTYSMLLKARYPEENSGSSKKNSTKKFWS
jgi:glyoxylase-like metal-dependent hydrolase (beta-lactamase superfamily II)